MPACALLAYMACVHECFCVSVKGLTLFTVSPSVPPSLLTLQSLQLTPQHSHVSIPTLPDFALVFIDNLGVVFMCVMCVHDIIVKLCN